MKKIFDKRLYDFATKAETGHMRSVEEHGTIRAAAKVRGLNKATIAYAIKRVEKRAAVAGYAPEYDMTHIVPDGFKVKGVSTYYNKDGEKTGQWVKSQADDARREEMVKEFVRSLTEDVRGMSPLVKAPTRSVDDLLVAIPIGDPHFGMYAWAKETGASFDTEIARELALGAVDRLIAAAPYASAAVLLPLGDIFHADDQSNETPGHGNKLDTDTRFVRVMGVVIQVYKHKILRLLAKYPKVIVRFVSGNHDPHAVWALAYAISSFFENNPRVVIDLSPSDFWYYQFGSVLIGSTHGHKVKPTDLGGIMAADQPQAWGQTKFRYWYTGHVHTKNVYELPGVTCESFRTLAPADAWAAGQGYRAGRDMQLIVHHREFGEIERHRCDVGMLEQKQMQIELA